MDPIDRQEILAETDKWLNDLLEDDSAKEMRVGIRMVRVYMKQMSAVQPERPTGHWEHNGYHSKCSACGIWMCDTDWDGDAIPNSFCPNCGADMRGEQDAVN